MSFAKNPIRILECVVLVTATLVTLAILIWLLSYSRYGIDLTDESHYLIWMANPDFYPVSVTQFGFIYHPLHWLVQGDIARLRQANILIIFSLAWTLCVVFFKTTLPSWGSPAMLALAACVATSAFVYFCTYGWLVTPSYNSLVFQALMLSSIGFLLAEKTTSSLSVIGWLLIGIGGWLTFMAKPSSAALLGIVISACLYLEGKFTVRLFMLAVLSAIVLLILSAWLIDGSVFNFIQRFKDGLEAVRLLDAGQGKLFKIDKLAISYKGSIFFVLFSSFSFVILYLVASEKKIATLFGLSLTLLLALLSLIIITGYVIWQFDSPPYKTFSALLILATPLSIVIFRLIKQSKVNWHIAIYFLLLPYIMAFGSNNNYWLQSSLGSLFWILAGLTLLMPVTVNTKEWRTLLPAIVSGQLLSVFLLQYAMLWPYSQAKALFQHDTPTTIGSSHSELLLPSEHADYYHRVQKAVQQANFQAGTPVLDLTGEGSGTLYAMQAKAIGYPWLVGGFSGSESMVKLFLNRVSCQDIAAAWLLIDWNTPVKLPLSLLNHIGLDFEQDFEKVATFSIAPIFITRHAVYLEQQIQLWKPKNSLQNKIAICEQKRTAPI